MPMHFLIVLCCAAVVAAVELPVTAVTIAPDGVLVERSGVVPEGDTQVSGLPLTLAPEALSVVIAGVARPAWQIVVPDVAAVETPPALWAERIAAEDALTAAEALAARAAQRRLLADAALAAPPTPAPGQAPTLPDPAVQQTLRSLLTDQYEKAAADDVAAMHAKQVAEARLTAANAALEAARPVHEAGTTLNIPGAGGRAVTVSYRLPGGGWLPKYRLEIANGSATLVRLAEIRLPASDRFASAPLVLTTRPAQRDLMLADPPVRCLGVPELATLTEPRQPPAPVELDTEMGGDGAFMAIGAGGGAAGMFGNRTGGGKRRAVAANGGNKGSESGVDAGLRWLKSRQSSDGAIADGPLPVASTALATMAFLGAGYDHRMPSKYRNVVQNAVAWLGRQDVNHLDLPSALLLTCALAEDFAMSNDPAMRLTVELALTAVTPRLRSGELVEYTTRNGAFAGPEILSIAAIALKSLIAGGITVPDDLLPRMSALAHVPMPDAGEGRLTGLCLEVMMGRQPDLLDSDLSTWLAAAPRWLEVGTINWCYLACHICFQAGGETWQQWNEMWRNLAVSQCAEDGSPRCSHPAGQVAAGALLTMSLQFYYRYSRVGGPARLTEASAQVLDVTGRAQGWPLRLVVPAIPLTAGNTTIEIDRIVLPGTVIWQAVPVADDTVQRVLPTRNPLADVLPTGAIAVEIDGEPAGSFILNCIAPGAAMTLPLGADLRLRVRREGHAVSDDGMRSRTTVATITVTLDAPADFTGTVEVSEPLPKPTAELTFALREPELSGKALAARLEHDPVWRVHLSAGASAKLVWAVTHPVSVRPTLEFAP